MSRFVAVSGWVVAAAACAVALWLGAQVREKDAEARRLSGEIAQLRAESRQMGESLDTLQKSLANLQGKWEEGMLGELNARPGKDGAAADPGPAAALGGGTAPDISKLVSGLLGGAEKQEKPAGGPAGIMDMFKGEQGRAMREMSAKMSVGMQYDGFMDLLGLDQERQDEVRRILEEYMMETLESATDAMDGDSDAMEKKDGDAKARMRERLKAVIGADGLAAFDEYEEELPARMMEQALDMQLRMMGGVAEENIARIKEVILEELPLQPTEPNFNPDNMAGVFQGQQEGYERALARLAEELPEQEYRTVERFVRQQAQMMEMMGQMVSSGMGGATAP